VTLTRASLDKLEDFLGFLLTFGRLSVKLNCLLSTGAAASRQDLRPDADDYLRVIRKGGRTGQLLLAGLQRYVCGHLGRSGRMTCGAGNYLSIRSNGEVYPCHTFQSNEFLGGNVRSQRLSDIWSNSAAFTSLRELDIATDTDCKDCSYRRFCRGGCRGLADQAGGVTTRPPDCSDRQKLWRYILPRVLTYVSPSEACTRDLPC
jgi:radical SAM protein with 4Fe4S-binding SPASM domain